MLKHRSIALVIALLAAVVTSQPAGAQQLSYASPSLAPAARSIVYRLNEEATFNEGCYPPCRCALFEYDDLRGTLILQQRRGSRTSSVYDVRDVNWWARQGDDEIRITGTGTYTRIRGFEGWGQRLVLVLSIDGEEPVRFDSGYVRGGGDFPDIDISVAQNGFYCYDRAFNLSASIVPSRELICERLTDESVYEEGCLPPCLCPIFVGGRPVGGFALVEIANYGTFIEYAVVNFGVRIKSEFETPSASFVGYGRYTRISGFAGWIHRMELDLSVDGEPPTRFDSGLVNGGGEFPDIDITIAQNGFYCYDIVLDLITTPCRSPMLTGAR